MPVSLREAGNTEMNTQASMMRISLASTVADPLERLLAINRASKAAGVIRDLARTIMNSEEDAGHDLKPAAKKSLLGKFDIKTMLSKKTKATKPAGAPAHAG